MKKLVLVFLIGFSFGAIFGYTLKARESKCYINVLWFSKDGGLSARKEYVTCTTPYAYVEESK